MGGSAARSRRLLNGAGIGLVELDAEGVPWRIRELLAEGATIAFERRAAPARLRIVLLLQHGGIGDEQHMPPANPALGDKPFPKQQALPRSRRGHEAPGQVHRQGNAADIDPPFARHLILIEFEPEFPAIKDRR